MIDEKILGREEIASFALRLLYSESGYSRFRMSKFEEYALYSENKEFLVSDSIITFTDAKGKLFALKPDVTLSIIKNLDASRTAPVKYYYDERVYRPDIGGTYKEITQVGVECIGDLSEDSATDVCELASKSLAAISDSFLLTVSHIGLVEALLTEYGVSDRKAALKAISDKNSAELKAMLTEDQWAALGALVKSYAGDAELLCELGAICRERGSRDKYGELSRLCNTLTERGYLGKYKIDLSLGGASGYYSGIVFKGFIEGVPSYILSGGAYDGLMRRLGKSGPAIGFAVYLGLVEGMQSTDKNENSSDYLNIALPKGRLGEKVYTMLEEAGFECPAIKDPGRKLIFENEEKKIRYFWVKPSDVAIYVERGAADVGIVGKDILLEYTPDVYELLDLGIGKCRMAVAAKRGFTDDRSGTLRVATKFTNIAKEYYSRKCRDIDVITLNGSIEIAPILGLSDVIVDIVETGKTLLENDLYPVETITEISARLISNKAAYGFKHAGVERIKEGLLEVIRKND